MEQTGDGQHIGPDVHEHEEKEARGVEGGQLGVVLQNLAQQRGNLQQHKLYICIKDYCITGRANPISCAVGLR